MAKSSLEKTWLFHEIGRCYLELNKAEEAQNYGEKSLQSADEEGDVEWQLNASILVAQAQVKLKDYQAAIVNFEKALEKAKLIHNDDAQRAIIIALDDVSKSFIKELKEGERETTADSPKDADCSSEYTEDNSKKTAEREESEEGEQSVENQTNEKQEEDAKKNKKEHGNDKEEGNKQEKEESKSSGGEKEERGLGERDDDDEA